MNHKHKNKTEKYSVKSFKKSVYISVFIFVFSVISITSIYFVNRTIDNEFFKTSGSGAKDIANLLANQVVLSDEDVVNLKNKNYHDLMLDSINRKLENSVKNVDFNTPVQYVYLVSLLDEDEVKYYVDSENQDTYNAPTGTPMNVIWLLDVMVENYNSIPNFYDTTDINRYTVMTDDLERVFENRTATYKLTNDEWGEVITGYSPVYTTEGNFIGFLGVDMSIISYKQQSKLGLISTLTIFAVTNLTILLMFLIFYRKYVKAKNIEMYRDPLTQAYNRRFYNELFLKKVKHGMKLRDKICLMMIDIDFFKRVNDTYGHSAGDECLKAVSLTIIEALARMPQILVRYGGEEFLLALKIENDGEALAIMESLLDSIRSLDLFDNEKKLTISIGAVMINQEDLDDKTISRYIDMADENLYYAKNHGRDQDRKSVV